MSAAHTPGPWEWSGNDLDSTAYEEVIKAEVSCGAFCYGGCVSMKISDADRSLIAAAPDLLAALQTAAEALAEVEEDRFNVDMDAVSSALNFATLTISRATGSAP